MGYLSIVLEGLSQPRLDKQWICQGDEHMESCECHKCEDVKNLRAPGYKLDEDRQSAFTYATIKAPAYDLVFKGLQAYLNNYQPGGYMTKGLSPIVKLCEGCYQIKIRRFSSCD